MLKWFSIHFLFLYHKVKEPLFLNILYCSLIVVNHANLIPDYPVAIDFLYLNIFQHQQLHMKPLFHLNIEH